MLFPINTTFMGFGWIECWREHCFTHCTLPAPPPWALPSSSVLLGRKCSWPCSSGGKTGELRRGPWLPESTERCCFCSCDKSFNVFVGSLDLLFCDLITYALFDQIKIYVCIYYGILEEYIMQVGRSELKEGDGKGRKNLCYLLHIGTCSDMPLE